MTKIIKKDTRYIDPDEEHPVGTGVGAVAGAAAGVTALGALEGAAYGTALGPVGIVAGAAVGGVIGGLLGERIAEVVNPTEEELYWKEEYVNRPYAEDKDAYESSYRSAYRYGVDSYVAAPDRRFDEVESDLSRGWDKARGNSALPWERARPAAKDAYERLYDRHTVPSLRQKDKEQA